ncbi:MAG: beta strand repeat-containing protein, partial [Roseimicrobium sp.]
NAAGITMNGGLVEFDISNLTAGVNYSETLGATTLNRGANGIVADQSAAAATSTLTFSDLIRNTGATANFASGTAFAVGTAGLGQTNQNSIILTLLNGVAPSAGFIGGWATVNTAASSTYATSITAAEWAKYDLTFGVQSFLPADYNGGGAFAEGSMTAATYHAKIGGATALTTSLTGARTAGSLHISSTNVAGNQTINQAGNAFTIDSGGILVSGTATTTAHLITGGTLTVGAGNELIVNTVGTNALTISSTIGGTMALTKSGIGVLTLSGTNSFSGGVYLNQGTLRFAPGLNGTSLALPASNNISVVTGTIASTTAGVLVIQNSMTIYDALTLGDGTGIARHILTGNITLSAPTGGIASIIAHTNTLAEIRGNISGGSLRIAQVGATGRVGLLGTNTFAATDRIQIDSGLLTVGSAGALGSAKIVMNGGGLEAGFGFKGAISNDILFTNNGTLGGTGYDNSLILSGSVDLGGAFRTITVVGTSAGSYTEISGVITNGGFDKASNGYLLLTNANNNYMGGTTVGDGVLWLKGNGVAGANVFGNNISLTAGATADIGIKLDGPSNLGSNQILTVNPSTGAAAQAISLGSGFAAATTLNPLIGFQNGATGTGTGIMNVRINDVASGKLLISLDGTTLNQDVIGGTGGTNTAAPLTRVWIGASLAGGVINSPLSAGFGGAYRLGGGLDMITTSTNQAGTLQVNAGVLSGSGTLFIGAEDATAVSNLGNGSIVWIKGAQSGFSGTVNIGSGGVLNVAEGSYLGTGNTINFNGGALRVLNESGLFGYDSGHINTSFASKNITVGVGDGVIRQEGGTGSFSNQIVQFGSVTLDASAGARTLTVAEGGLNNGGTYFTNLIVTGANQGIIVGSANYTRFTGTITTGAGGLQIGGAGNVILDTPSATSVASLLLASTGNLILTNPSNFTVSGITTVSGARLITARSDASTFTLNLGAIALSGGSPVITFGNLTTGGSASKTVTFSSAITATIATRTLSIRAFDNTTVNGTGAVTMGTSGFGFVFDIQAGYYNQSGLVSGVAGATTVSKTGRGVLELSNAGNTFSGGLNAGQGTLLISAAGAQGTGTISFTNGSGMFLASDTVNITNALQVGATTAAGTVTFGGLSGSQTYSGTLNMASVAGITATLGVANFGTGTTTFSGIISQGNSGVNNILKTGNGTVVFNQANTYGGAAAVTNTVQRGIFEGVAQASGSPFGNTANAFTVAGGTLKLTGIGSLTTTTHGGALTVGGV